MSNDDKVTSEDMSSGEVINIDTATTDEKPKLSQIERKQKKVAEEQAKLNLLLASDKEKQEKLDDRTKILLGVILQGAIKNGEITDSRMSRWLEKYITKKPDRSLLTDYYQQKSTNQIKPNIDD